MLKLKRKRIQQNNIKLKLNKSIKKTSHSYVLFNKHLLHLGDKLKFDLFCYQQPTYMSLFLQSDTIIDTENKKKLNEVEQLYIPDEDKERYKLFVESNLQNIVKNEKLSLDEKTDIIYESTSELTHSLFENPNALANVQHSKKIVQPILQSILYNEDTISSYMRIIEYDYYTHTHSLNVSIYALSLGAELNLSETALTSLGQAALLHDLGKSKIERNIVNKETKLTPYEFDRMKMHPTLGYEIAMNIGLRNKDILDGIRHHHEKLDGMGYPDHLSGNEISLFPRVIGICDVFDALTTRRTYKQAMHSYDALHLMKTRMHSHLDMHIVDTFIKMLHD